MHAHGFSDLHVPCLNNIDEAPLLGARRRDGSAAHQQA